MNGQPENRMRKLIISGTYAQYRDWLNDNHANPRAALYIHRPEQLRGLLPDDCEIVLTGTYHDNPAYQSPEYLDLINRPHIALAS